MSKRTQGRKAFNAFVKQYGLNPTTISKALGVTRPVVYSWIDGSKRPDAFSRAAIEIWTGGKIRTEDWWTRAENDALGKIVPFIAA